MRIRAKLLRYAITSAVVAIVGTSVPIIPGLPAYAATPSISVVGVKQSNFVNADTALIAGSGFTPKTRITVGQCVGDRPFVIGEKLSATTVINGHPFTNKLLYCTTGVAGNKQRIGSPYTAYVADDGTFVASVVLFRGGGTAIINAADNPTNQYTVNTVFDDKHPATIVAQDFSNATVYATTPATFAADATNTCGAADDATATAIGGSSSTPVYLSLVTAMCGGAGSKLPVDFTESGEFAGLQAFQNKQADFAFSSVGFSPPGSEKIAGSRKATFVPIALQAATVAFAGSTMYGPGLAPGFRTVTSVQATNNEVSHFLSSLVGPTPAKDPLGAAFVGRNLTLPQITTQDPIRYYCAVATDESSILAATTTF